MKIIQRYDVPFGDVTTSVAADATPAWLVGTTYAVGDEVLRGNRIWVSAVASNTGNDPLLSNQALVSAPWIFKAWENRFRCFDGTMVSRTSDEGPVTITIANVQGQDSILFFGLGGQSVTVEGYDSVPAKVYERTISLAAREVNNWYQWFFEPFGEAVSRAALTDIPANVESLELTFTGAAVEIGEILLGRVRNIGNTLYEGTASRVQSYTRVDFNAYGEAQVIPGPTRSEVNYRVHITKARMQQVYDIIARLSGQLVGAIGSETRQTTIQLGFLSIDEIPEDLPDDYIATFTLRGVI